METSNIYWIFGVGFIGLLYYAHQYFFEKKEKKVLFNLQKNRVHYITKEENLESRIAFTCLECKIKIKGIVFCMDDLQFCSEECRDKNMDKRYLEYQKKLKEKNLKNEYSI
jgi:hypothetical protein